MPISFRNTYVAILTGDVVASSRLSRDDRAHLARLLEEVLDTIRQRYSRAVPRSADIFRGDSWQLLVSQPMLALRVALSCRAVLRYKSGGSRLDTRVGIGIGGVDFVPDDGISRGDGEAFRLSGATLERLGQRGRRMDISMPDHLKNDVMRAMPVIVGLVDALVQQWTPGQAQAVNGALLGRTQQEIGASWEPEPISQQAVAQHLEGADWYAAAEAVAFFEAVMSEFVDPGNASNQA